MGCCSGGQRLLFAPGCCGLCVDRNLGRGEAVPRGLFSAKKMKRVWQHARNAALAGRAKALKMQREAQAKQKLVESENDKRARREAEALKAWNEKNRKAMRPKRSVEEQQRRIRAATGIHGRLRGCDEAKRQTEAANAGGEPRAPQGRNSDTRQTRAA